MHYPTSFTNSNSRLHFRKAGTIVTMSRQTFNRVTCVDFVPVFRHTDVVTCITLREMHI